jgi:hypothetical protein
MRVLSTTQPCEYINKLFLSKYFWIVAILAFLALLCFTMYKDYYFTGNRPNPVFYLSVPTIGIFSSALAVFLVSKLVKYSLTFYDTLKVILSAALVMQVWENIAKYIYYVIWEYPEILWFIMFPIALCITAYLFICVTKASWRYSLLFSVVWVITGNVVALIFISLTGISTPGS